MASPPFNINQSLPGDTDIVSQFPLNERGTRDIIESWLLVDHNNLGQHAKVSLPWAAAPTTPGSSLSLVYVDADGYLHIVDATRDQYVGLPPGTIIYTAGSSLDAGFLAPDGSAVSRTTFAKLFARIGTTYGVGDSSTTFNLPNIKGRVIAAEDASAGNLTAAGFGTSAVLGAVGGSETITMARANLPNTSVAVTVVDPGHVHSLVNGITAVNAVSTGTGSGTGLQTIAAIGVNSAFTGISASFNLNGNVTQTVMKTVQPTIILKAQIKF